MIYLPVAGSLNQDASSDLVTGLGPQHLGDATLLQYDAGAMIDMNNIAIGLTPYLPPFSGGRLNGSVPTGAD
jgi:hypothetical protein